MQIIKCRTEICYSRDMTLNGCSTRDSPTHGRKNTESAGALNMASWVMEYISKYAVSPAVVPFREFKLHFPQVNGIVRDH